MRKNIRRLVTVLIFATLAIPVLGNTYNVTSTSDFPITGAGISVNNATGVITGGAGNGLVTLRSAIAAANNVAGPHTINLGAGTYSLTISGAGETTTPDITKGDLDVTMSGVSILGAGYATTTIQQTTGIDRVFDVNVNYVAGVPFQFTLDGVTVSGGRDNTGNGSGLFCGSNATGGLTTVNNCRFLNNQTTNAGDGGGGISHVGGDLTVTNCIFGGLNPSDPNTAFTSGGAIYFDAFGTTATFTCTNNTFTNNVANSVAAGGGAIDVAAVNLGVGTVNITGCTFTGNHANTAGGGAVMNESVTLNITKSTFINNTAKFGGAVRCGGGAGTTVSFSRLIGNTASTSGNAFDGAVALNGNNNWWGVNSGPAAGSVTNSATASNWLQLKSSASPGTICASGGTTNSTATSGFLSNSLGNAIAPANLTALVGVPVSFVNPVLGTLSAAQPTIQASGTATVLFTATGTAGTGSVNAVVDNVPNNDALAKASITITKPAVTNPGVATGTINAAFSQNFTQAGGALPVSFTTASVLPTGLSLSTAGVLSGTPTQLGSFPIVVTVTDNNGCTGAGATYVLVISCQTITVTNPAVATATNGTQFNQSFTQSGAIGGATFSLNTGSIPNALNLSAGGALNGTPSAPAATYPMTIKVTDGNGCTGIGPTYNLVVSGPLAPALSASLRDNLQVDVNSNGQANNGDQIRYTNTIRNQSTVDATGVNFQDTVPVNTTLVGGSRVTSALARDDAFTTFFNTNLNSGNVITNDFGLPSVTVATFGTTASFGVTTAAGSAGTTDQGGTLTVNANGTFSYTPPVGFSGTDKFMYIATTGVAGLPNNDAVVTITVNPDIVFGTTKVDVVCNGASTGSITFTGVSGGSGSGYTFSVNGAGGPFQAGNPYTGLPAGTYTPAVKDGAGYIKVSVTTVTLNQPATAPSFTHVDVNNTCAGASAGTITITASGGTPGYTYSKTGAGGTYQASNVFSGLTGSAGGTVYNLAVKDNVGCIVTGTATLTDPPLITFTTTPVNITCNGGSDGSITFSASGGTGTLNYSITGSGGTYQASNAFTGLIAATYNPAVKDGNSCIVTAAAITLTQPLAVVVSGTIPNLTYNVAMANATFTKTNGAGAPANPWSATGLPTGVSINTATGVVSGTPLQTGSFNATITYTDATNCIGTKVVAFTVAPNLANNTYNVVGNTQLVAGGQAAPATPSTSDATNILTNDQADVTIAVTAGTFATTGGGSITIDAAGKFTYTPVVGSTAADSYVYTGTANGVSATATINFTIANMVWYVNQSYGGGSGVSDGRSHRPYTTVNAAEAASAINQVIYVHTGAGNTNGDALLKSGQTLRGAGSALTVGALSLGAGTKPTLTGMITLANSVNVDGFDMNTGATTAITSSGATSVAVAIGNITTSGATNAITLTNTTGSVSNTGGTLTGAAGGAVFNVSGGTATITNAANIVQTLANRAINIASSTGGTITFSGTVSSTGTSTGINLTTNTGATINFTNTLTLNTGANAAFTATGGGTITATDANSTIITTTATALNVVSTTIGAGNLKFKSISSNGSANGIVLTSTGTTGSLIVTGNGGASSDGSGGTIQATTGHAILINNACNVNLGYMNITNPGVTGIQAGPLGYVYGSNSSTTGPNNVSVNHCNISDNAGNVSTDDGITLANTTGNISITNSSINAARHQGITIDNVDNNMASMLISSTSVTNTPGGDGILIQMRGTSVMTTGTIGGASAALGNTVSSNSATGIQVSNADNGNILSLNIQFNTLNANNAGIDLDIAQAASLTATVQNNTLTNHHTTALNTVASTTSSGASTLTVTFRNNNIGIAGVLDSGSGIGTGIRVANGGVNVNLTIDGNVIREVPNGRGIDIEPQAYIPNLNCKVKIVNNQVIRPTGTLQNIGCGFHVPCPSASVFILSDNNGVGGFAHICTSVTGNTAYDPTSWPAGGEGAYYFARRSTTSNTLTLEGNTGLTPRVNVLNNNTVTNFTAADFVDEGAPGMPVVVVAVGSCGAFPAIVAPPNPSSTGMSKPIEMERTQGLSLLKDVIPIKKDGDKWIKNDSKKAITKIN